MKHVQDVVENGQRRRNVLDEEYQHNQCHLDLNPR